MLSAVVALTMALVSVACGGESGPPAPQSAHLAIWEGAWATASEPQREAMKDGVVTFDEYEEAALNAVQCVNGIGMTGEAVYDEATRVFQVAARLAPPPGGTIDPNSPDIVEKRRLTEACYVEHWYAVNDAWAAQNMPTEEESVAAIQAFRSCLIDWGFDISLDSTSEQVQAHLGKPGFFECADKAGAEFGIPNFGGG